MPQEPETENVSNLTHKCVKPEICKRPSFCYHIVSPRDKPTEPKRKRLVAVTGTIKNIVSPILEKAEDMKRDYEQHGDASMIVTMFDNAYEQAFRQAKNNSVLVQRLTAVTNQIQEMEECLQDAISHQVAALREAALEQSAELNEALSNGEVTIDDIDLDIRSGLTPGSVGVSFYDADVEEGSEAQIYTELVNDLRERLKTLQQERQTIEEEQGVLAIMKKNFEYFIACLKELPDTNANGMPLVVNGLDVQGSLRPTKRISVLR